MISIAARNKVWEAKRSRKSGSFGDLSSGLGADAKTYEEWFTTATTTYQVEGGYGGNRWQRAIYMMLGHEIFIETYFPWNIFRPNSECSMVPGFNVTEDDPVITLAKENGGRWMEGWYAEEGYGWPRWEDGGDGNIDCAKLCWDFLTAYNARK